MLNTIIKVATFCGMAVLLTACNQSTPTPATTGDTTIAPADTTATTPNTTNTPAATTAPSDTTQGST